MLMPKNGSIPLLPHEGISTCIGCLHANETHQFYLHDELRHQASIDPDSSQLRQDQGKCIAVHHYISSCTIIILYSIAKGLSIQCASH